FVRPRQSAQLPVRAGPADGRFAEFARLVFQNRHGGIVRLRSRNTPVLAAGKRAAAKLMMRSSAPSNHWTINRKNFCWPVAWTVTVASEPSGVMLNPVSLHGPAGVPADCTP